MFLCSLQKYVTCFLRFPVPALSSHSYLDFIFLYLYDLSLSCSIWIPQSAVPLACMDPILKGSFGWSVLRVHKGSSLFPTASLPLSLYWIMQNLSQFQTHSQICLPYTPANKEEEGRGPESSKALAVFGFISPSLNVCFMHTVSDIVLSP